MTFRTFRTLGAASALMLSTAAIAHADSGTLAGTLVTNTIDISYNSGPSSVDRPGAASTSFTVDRKVDYLVQETVGGVVLVDLGADDSDGTGTMTFELRNLSNDDIGYALGINPAGGISYVVLVDGATYTEGDTITVAKDGTAVISIIADFPPGTGGSDYPFEVVAKPVSHSPSTAADIANLMTTSTVFLFDEADMMDDALFRVIEPRVGAAKDVFVVSQDPAFACDDMNAPAETGAQAAIPGACVEYTIRVRNGGGAAARNLQVVDALPAQVSYEAAYSADFSLSENAGVITATALSPLTNGQQYVIRIRARID